MYVPNIKAFTLSLIFGVFLLALDLHAAAPSQQYDSGDPTPDEQLVLEYVNRARADPAVEGRRLVIDINEGLDAGLMASPSPPLAMNKILLGVARAHSQDMWTRKYFDHVDPDGNNPFDRIMNAGYPFDGPEGENIAASTNLKAAQLEDLLMVDKDEPHRGHRVNLLDIGFPMHYSEIGVGFYAGATAISGGPANGLKNFITQDFGASNGPFVLGVVYTDANKNNFYDLNEGVSGVTITPDSGTYFAVSGSAGGYAIPVAKSGTLTLTASGGPLTTPVTKTVMLTGVNQKVDFIVGAAAANGAPLITSALIASAAVNSPFTYTVTASGTAPITFNALGLPAGLSFSGSTITGTPSQAGTTNVTLTATNSAGNDTKTLVLTVTGAGGGGGAPVITSALTATGTVNTAFRYTLTATGADTITFSASPLPPGLTLSGATITGTPTQAGQFVVPLTATNSVGSDQKSLVISISMQAVSLTNIDTDGDGFPDEIEEQVGTSPTDPTNTPFGGAPAGTPQSLTLKTLAVRLNFAPGSSTDSLMLTGSLPLPDGFTIAGQKVVVDIGGIVGVFTLDAKGSGSAGVAGFKLRFKQSKGIIAAQTAAFTLKASRASFASLLADEGLVNQTTTTPVPVAIPVVVLFNQQLFKGSVAKQFTAVINKTGMVK